MQFKATPERMCSLFNRSANVKGQSQDRKLREEDVRVKHLNPGQARPFLCVNLPLAKSVPRAHSSRGGSWSLRCPEKQADLCLPPGAATGARCRAGVVGERPGTRGGVVIQVFIHADAPEPKTATASVHLPLHACPPPGLDAEERKREKLETEETFIG